ncbi:MAG TPA: LPXTG cell wall anchor domain-containing protein [Catenuloplanes sp.]|jgi:LPXTG-motif cell wall-anchored protein
MNRWINRGVATAGLAAGAWLLTAAPAHADTTDQPTTNPTRATVTLRVDLDGGAIDPRTRPNASRVTTTTASHTNGQPTHRSTTRAGTPVPGRTTARLQVGTSTARPGRPTTARVQPETPGRPRIQPGTQGRTTARIHTGTPGRTTARIQVGAPAGRPGPTSSGRIVPHTHPAADNHTAHGRLATAWVDFTVGDRGRSGGTSGAGTSDTGNRATLDGDGIPGRSVPTPGAFQVNGDVCLTLGTAAGCHPAGAGAQRPTTTDAPATVTGHTTANGRLLNSPPTSAALELDAAIQPTTAAGLAANAELCLTVGRAARCGRDEGPARDAGPTNRRAAPFVTVAAALAHPQTAVTATVAGAAGSGSAGGSEPGSGDRSDSGSGPGSRDGAASDPGSGGAGGSGAGPGNGSGAGDGDGSGSTEGTAGDSGRVDGAADRTGGAVNTSGTGGLPRLLSRTGASVASTRLATALAGPAGFGSSDQSGGLSAGRLPRTGAAGQTLSGAGIAMVLIGILLILASRRRRV